ncbi:MAG: DUF3800 domain-containing protein, partial [Longimicrobiaceae bacterium]
GQTQPGLSALSGNDSKRKFRNIGTWLTASRPVMMLPDSARPARSSFLDPAERRRGGPVWDSVRHIYVGRHKPEWTVALSAYFDDSRQYSNGLGYHAIGGYVATTDFWDTEFSPRWKRLIDSAPHKIGEWKTSDCRGGYGEFSELEGWTIEERRKFTVQVVDELLSYPYLSIVGFGAVVVMPTHEDEKEAKRFEEHALRLGLLFIVGAICAYARDNRNSEEINCLCDEQKGWEGRLTDVWNSVVRGEKTWFSGEISKLRFDDSKKVLPLQAADLLAYEIRKDVIDRLERPQFPRSMALHRLLGGHPHLGVLVDSEHIDDMNAARAANRPPPLAPFLFLSEGVEVNGYGPFRLVGDPRPPR